MTPHVRHYYHEDTGTLSYVVSDPDSTSAAIIDPVLGFCPESGRTDTNHADTIAGDVASQGLDVEWILETHAHADHLSAAQHLKQKLGGRIGIGSGICDVQRHFAKIFNLKPPFEPDGRQFDHLFADGENFRIGALDVRVMRTPGHTDDSVSYVFDGAAFIGDTLFMTDGGTARCDFPGGDAGRLYDSIARLLELPDDTLLYLCHDYPPDDRPVRASASVAEQKAANIHVGGGVGKDEFVAMRNARDETLSLPRLIIPSIQVNIRAGALPDAEDNGIAYIRIPLDRF